ncbi:predicted protein [Nematostella vectensis]|uniref:Ricin B lectin domain-containing protein n=1 Tax=Nematostella vectensis TaxID=45351 RepID=A7RJ47_NEMVE|nr:predicted protein [Nematostella vectensis]|eukprot:XP_001640577.1 predicted protein [Nematostella vectensis]
MASLPAVHFLKNALYIRRKISGEEEFPKEATLQLKEYIRHISSKVNGHKETVDKAINDLSEKFNESLQRMNNKISSLHQVLHEKRSSMADKISELRFTSDKSESNTSTPTNSLTFNSKGDISQGDRCVDTMERTEGGFPELFACHQKGGNQEWEYTSDNQLKNPLRGDCLTAPPNKEKTIIELRQCSSDSPLQKWERSGESIKLIGSDRCLDVHSDGIVAVRACDQNAATQKWKFSQ